VFHLELSCLFAKERHNTVEGNDGEIRYHGKQPIEYCFTILGSTVVVGVQFFWIYFNEREEKKLPRFLG
jgi:hypothetical protein